MSRFPRGGMGNMMKQVQKMQRQMEETQKRLEETITENSAGGGAVNVEINGKNEIVNLTIDKDVIDADDIEMLQDLIISAVNGAISKAKKHHDEEMQKITGGISIPGL